MASIKKNQRQTDEESSRQVKGKNSEDREINNLSQMSEIPKILEFKPVSKKKAQDPESSPENFPRNRFSPEMNEEIIERTLRLARELKLPNTARNASFDVQTVETPKSDLEVRKSKIKDQGWINQDGLEAYEESIPVQ